MKTKQASIDSPFDAQTRAAEVIEGISLAGKVCVITGGHSGIGLENTRIPAKAGAHVVVGARDLEKAQSALSPIENVTIAQLDLADPQSVSRFAASFLSSHQSLDLLINNAGIMATPFRRVVVDLKCSLRRIILVIFSLRLCCGRH